MPNRNELKALSRTRLKEVKILYDNRLYDGASYLSGYVIELALKARICKILDLDYPDRGDISRSFKTHKLDNLIKLGGLYNKFDTELNTNNDFKINWSLIKTWSEEFRYQPKGSNSKNDVKDLIEAIEDTNNGILTWIKRRW